MGERSKAVVCLSGGLDSCVATAIAKCEYELALLHVNYGQRTETKESSCFSAIADYKENSQGLPASYHHGIIF
jgi:7-cyano-7-deazaguanine synthase